MLSISSVKNNLYLLGLSTDSMENRLGQKIELEDKLEVVLHK